MSGQLSLYGSSALLLSGLLAAQAGATALAPRGASPIHNVTKTRELAEAEPTISYNPTNPRNLIVGGNLWQPLTYSNNWDLFGLGPSGFTQCAQWSSFDSGRTWQGGPIEKVGVGTGAANPVTVRAESAAEPELELSERNVPAEFEDPGNLYSADQSTVFDRSGTAYYSCFEFGVAGGVEVINVWRSRDGGRTWSQPVAAFHQVADTDRQMDRPFLAIDQSRGPRDGTLYVAWETIFYDPFDPRVYVRASHDGGQTWGPVVRVDDRDHPAMWDARLFPMVGADGALYVIYDSARLTTPFQWHPQAEEPSLVLARSTDEGRHFTYNWVVRHAKPPAPPDEAEPEFTEWVSSMATDPRRAGRVAVAWPEMVDGRTRILLRSSLDGGRSWSPTIDVADDPPHPDDQPDYAGGPIPPLPGLGPIPYPPGRGNQHDHVMVRYLPDGRLVVVWRDRRYTGGGWWKPWDVFARVVSIGPHGSLRPGRTLRLTKGSQEPSTTHRGHMPTEYLAVTIKNVGKPRGIGVAWEEMRGFYPDNVYRFVPLSAFGPRGRRR